MSATTYRAGLNLEADPTQAALTARLKADSFARAGCRAEFDAITAENQKSVTMGNGSIFQRCHVTKSIHQALETALQQVEG